MVLCLSLNAFADGATINEYMGSGVAAEAAKLTGESVLGAIAATGTLTSDAYAIKNSVNTFTTVTAGSAEAAKLPAKSVVPRDVITVVNNGAGVLNVFPPTGGNINMSAANLSYPVAVGQAIKFQRTSATAWVTSITTGSAAVYVVTAAATPAAGTNDVRPGISVFPTAAANTAALLPPTPIVGQTFRVFNSGPNAVRVKAGVGINGAAAGTYIPLATFQEAVCLVPSGAATYLCNVETVPTPAGP